MNDLDLLRAFLSVAAKGSFTKAADELSLSPPVLTKRIAQLEHMIGRTLIDRTTRRVQLSSDGQFALKRVAALVAEFDNVVASMRAGPTSLEGSIRIKVPSTLGVLRLNALIRRFSNENPGIDIELLLLDGPMNPVAEGIDIAITAFPATFDGVMDEFLWPISRSVVAAPAYLDTCEVLDHPRQLERHSCLVYQPTGPYWTFLGTTGLIGVTVKSHLASNDMNLLLNAAIDADGLALISDYVSSAQVAAGTLRKVLPDFPVPNMWVKAMVPRDKRQLPHIEALISFLREEGKPSETAGPAA